MSYETDIAFKGLCYLQYNEEIDQCYKKEFVEWWKWLGEVVELRMGLFFLNFKCNFSNFPNQLSG